MAASQNGTLLRKTTFRKKQVNNWWKKFDVREVRREYEENQLANEEYREDFRSLGYRKNLACVKAVLILLQRQQKRRRSFLCSEKTSEFEKFRRTEVGYYNFYRKN